MSMAAELGKNNSLHDDAVSEAVKQQHTQETTQLCLDTSLSMSFH